MTRRGTLTNVFSRGVLDALLRERMDLEHYSRGLEIGDNVVVLPQGGCDLRGGFRHKQRLRRQLRRLTLTAGMVTAPNGGTVANLVDCQDTTDMATTSGVSGDPFVVAQLDLGTSETFCFVDVVRVKCASSSADNALEVQTSPDASTWTTLDNGRNIRTTARTRRFSAAAGQSVTARYVRVVIVGAPSIGVITLAEVAIWSELDRLSAVKKFKFNFDRQQTYTLIATDRNVDVFRRGEWQTAVPIPHRSDQLETVTRSQSRDVLILWHNEVQPQTLFRQGAHDEWDSYAQTFSNVASGGGSTSFGQAQDEVQRITIDGIGASDTFALIVGDCWTAAITKGSDAGTLATAIDTGLEALPALSSGIEVSVGSLTTDAVTFDVTFGGGNGARVQPQLAVDVLTTDDAVVTVETLQDGRAASGDLMSITTGWPRCGTFTADDRLLIGGFQLAPDTMLASVTGNYFDFDQDTALEAAAGIQFTLGSDDQVIILHLFAGRHIQVFTASGEWYVPDRVLDATQPINFVNSTRNGVKAGIAQDQVEGATLFVDASGDVIRDFVFSDVEQDYTADSLTLLGSDLLTDIQDWSYLRASDANEGSQVLIVNGDGSMAGMTFMRAEKVRAMTPWTFGTGEAKAINVDAERNVDLVIERTVDGVTDLYLERQDLAALFDHSVTYDLGSPGTSITGLDHLEGLEVWATADGYIDGPFTVSGGAIELNNAATAGEVGERIVPRIKPMRFVPQDRSGRVHLGPIRVFGATLSLFETTSVAFAANGGDAQEVPLGQFDETLLDVAPIDKPFTGEIRLDRLFGRSDGGADCEVTQLRPGYLTLRAIKMEVG